MSREIPAKLTRNRYEPELLKVMLALVPLMDTLAIPALDVDIVVQESTGVEASVFWN